MALFFLFRICVCMQFVGGVVRICLTVYRRLTSGTPKVVHLHVQRRVVQLHHPHASGPLGLRQKCRNPFGRPNKLVLICLCVCCLPCMWRHGGAFQGVRMWCGLTRGACSGCCMFGARLRLGFGAWFWAAIILCISAGGRDHRHPESLRVGHANSKRNFKSTL